MAATALERGKQFEGVFKKDWERTFPNQFLFRLKDQMNGFKTTSKNPCDFLAHNNGILWMVEVKETKENTFNFKKLTQYDLLTTYIGLEDVIPVVVIWFSLRDKVVAVPITEVMKMIADGKKSVNLKMLDTQEYIVLDIPSKKKRVFLESDYTEILKLKELR